MLWKTAGYIVLWCFLLPIGGLIGILIGSAVFPIYVLSMIASMSNGNGKTSDKI